MTIFTQLLVYSIVIVVVVAEENNLPDAIDGIDKVKHKAKQRIQTGEKLFDRGLSDYHRIIETKVAIKSW